mmetsp:Transcript_26324/g.61400  ORF Transcript_26324/g.61400 Transcript_26324/m.61400 type:complete len:235 (-) Transcript_26324:382-1086(-)
MQGDVKVVGDAKTQTMQSRIALVRPTALVAAAELQLPHDREAVRNSCRLHTLSVIHSRTRRANRCTIASSVIVEEVGGETLEDGREFQCVKIHLLHSLAQAFQTMRHERRQCRHGGLCFVQEAEAKDDELALGVVALTLGHRPLRRELDLVLTAKDHRVGAPTGADAQVHVGHPPMLVHAVRCWGAEADHGLTLAVDLHVATVEIRVRVARVGLKHVGVHLRVLRVLRGVVGCP